MDIVKRGLNAGDPRFWIEECLNAEKLLRVSRKEAVFNEFAGAAIDECDEQPWVRGEKVPGQNLIDGYRDWVKRLGIRLAEAVKPADFRRILTSLEFEGTKRNGVRARLVPDPDECREKLEGLWR